MLLPIILGAIIVAVVLYLYYFRERYSVCVDCDKELGPFGVVINPFIWPFSGSGDLAQLRRDTAQAEGFTSRAPPSKPRFHYSFEPDHPLVEGQRADEVLSGIQ